MAKSGFAVIGLGQFGKHLAVTLSRAGARVVAMDRDAQRVEEVKDQVARAVRADSTDERALRAARIEEVGCAVIALGEEDFESSVLTVVHLASMGIHRIVARSFSPLRGKVLQRVGASTVVFPEVQAAEQLAHHIMAPGVDASLALPSGYTLAQVIAPRTLAGLSIRECALRHRLRVNVIAVRRSKSVNGEKVEETVEAGPEIVVEEGDILVVAGRTENVDALGRDAV